MIFPITFNVSTVVYINNKLWYEYVYNNVNMEFYGIYCNYNKQSN